LNLKAVLPTFSSMRIPQDKIDEIRRATDIIEYIGNLVKLRKRGKNYIGLCPFHAEKTPSFNVSPEKEMYYCFGCGKGGDIIKFVMEWEKASYVEAVEILAERAGIIIQRTDEATASSSEIEKLYDVCTFAANIFQRNVLKSEEGKFALQYFRSRGFQEPTIRSFMLGYSLRSWESLLQQAKEGGIAAEYLEKVGLCRKREDGTYYDAFRGRAMFPIFSSNGRIIAFGARKLYDDDTLGKYINSPETTIYHKSKVLYGLYQAKEAIREKDSVVLVEGYADLISIFQSGTRHAVASSGTALTPEQTQLISRYTKNIILVYDADPAGMSAMMRGVDIILENNLDVRILILPNGEDPDSYVKKEGGPAFNALIARAVSFIDFKASVFQTEGKLDTPEGRAEAVRSLVQSISKIKDPLKRSFFIKDVAVKYGLYESSLYGELEKYIKKVPDKFLASPPQIRKEKETALEEMQEQVSDTMPIEERELLSVILDDPSSMIPFVFSYVPAEEFHHPISQRIVHILVDEFDEKGKVEMPALLARSQNDATRRMIQELSLLPYQLGSKWDAVGAKASGTMLWEKAEGAIKRLKKKILDRQVEENQRFMKTASLNGEDTVPFLQKHHDLTIKIQEIAKIHLPKPALKK
jgi:DNA primase